MQQDFSVKEEKELLELKVIKRKRRKIKYLKSQIKIK